MLPGVGAQLARGFHLAFEELAGSPRCSDSIPGAWREYCRRAAVPACGARRATRPSERGQGFESIRIQRRDLHHFEGGVVTVGSGGLVGVADALKRPGFEQPLARRIEIGLLYARPIFSPEAATMRSAGICLFPWICRASSGYFSGVCANRSPPSSAIRQTRIPFPSWHMFQESCFG